MLMHACQCALSSLRMNAYKPARFECAHVYITAFFIMPRLQQLLVDC